MLYLQRKRNCNKKMYAKSTGVSKFCLLSPLPSYTYGRQNLLIFSSSSTSQRSVELMWYPFIHCLAVRLSVRTQLYLVPTKYHKDPLMVSYCWFHGLVVHVPFWSSPDPMTHFGIFSCFRYLCTYTPYYGYSKFDWLVQLSISVCEK